MTILHDDACPVQPSPDAESDPSTWPSWTDAHVWEPTDVDWLEYSEWAESVAPYDASPEDRAFWGELSNPEGLAWLEEQRAACQPYPETLSRVLRSVAAVRRYLIDADVAEAIAGNSLVGHDAEGGVAC